MTLAQKRRGRRLANLLFISLGVMLFVVACAANMPPRRAPAENYWIPSHLKDSDTLCVDWQGVPLCKPVKQVRDFIAAMEADDE